MSLGTICHTGEYLLLEFCLMRTSLGGHLLEEEMFLNGN